MGLIWKYLTQYRKTLILALVLASINQGFSLLDPQIFRLIIDRYVSRITDLPRHEFLTGVTVLLLASAGVAMTSRIAKNFQDYFVNMISQRLGAGLYARGVAHSFSLPYAVFEDQRSGELLQKLQKARADIQLFITASINNVFLALIGLLFVLAYAFTVHWTIGLAYFLVVPLLSAGTFFISRKIKVAQEKIIAETAGLAGSTTETLRNVELVKSLGLEYQEISRLNKVNNLILELELKKIKLIRALSFIQGTAVSTIRLIILLLMLWLIFNKNITVGEFFSLFIYSFFIFGPLTDLSTVASQYQEARASSEQVEKILQMKPAPKPAQPVTIGPLTDIQFNNITFAYNSNERPALKNFSLKATQGQTIALVGPSGSGKSTAVKLLVGLYEPTQGDLRLNGKDSRRVAFDEIRQRIGLVAQETQLFAGTIRENLLFVNPEANDEECLAALKAAAAIPIVERAEKGLDTKIGEGGIKISGGERQRLAIARALLRKPELIIFDEATSNLDSITEKSITETIQSVTAENVNRMILIIAHRLSTIAHADTIYVLERGEIVEQGNHNELLHNGGLYAALWREQSTAVDVVEEAV